MTLITKNTKIKKEIKDKETGKLLPVKGVKFCQYLGTVTDGQPRENTYDKKLPNGKTLKFDSGNQYCSEPTNEKGETWLQIDEMEYGESYLIEEHTSDVATINTKTGNQTPVELKQPAEPTKIYVDLGVRFLGETDGSDLISYQDLRKTIREGGKDIGKDLEFNENDGQNGKWLKIYDIRKNKVLYIAKKPLTNKVDWNKLCKAGVVFGLDQINVDGTLQPHFKASESCWGTYQPKILKRNNRTYIVRLLKTTKENKPNENLTTDWNTFKTKTIIGSEWNRYILPLVKEYRYLRDTTNQLEESLKKYEKEGYLGDKNFYIQLSEYNWFKDLTLGKSSSYGQYSWMQEKASSDLPNWRTLRGDSNGNYGAAGVNAMSYSYYTNDDYGFRPGLEEIPQNCYDGACFEGEVAGTDFITYKDLKSNLETSEHKIGTATKLEGDEKTTGGNWLKIHDYKEDKTLYISKKPITYDVSWNDIYNAGAVYGLDMLNKDGTPQKSNLGFEQGVGVNEMNNTPPSEYRGKILTINGKNYIVRLLKGFNTSVNKGNPNIPSNDYKGEAITNHSEWNRYILPLVKATSGQRWGVYTKSTDYLENKLQNNTIQLAGYKWFGDLTSENGWLTWTQEFAEYNRNYRAFRGSRNTYDGVAFSYRYNSDYIDYYRGFRPVLEEIN